jgi:hypothetical protein
MRMRSWLMCLAAPLLVASWTATADAETRAATAEKQGHVMRLLGTTYCFGDVTPDVTCDWRSPPAKPAKTLSILGFRICLGATDDASCDLRVPAATAGEVTASAMSERADGAYPGTSSQQRRTR